MRSITHSGKVANLLELVPDAKDIAWHLGRINRFCGAGERSLSVAQHSLLVAALSPHGLRAQALLHDAHEAYLNDIPTGTKQAFKALFGDSLEKFENMLAGRVRRHFGLPEALHPEVKKADITAARFEVGAIFNPKARESFSLSLGFTPLYGMRRYLRPMEPEEASRALLVEMKLLGLA